MALVAARALTRAQPALSRSFSLFGRSSPSSSSPASDSPPPPPPADGPEDHDLVLVGGGPAGLTLAAALASSPAIAATHRITLLEAFPLASSRNWAPKDGEWSNRVSSITNENVRFLSQTGIWRHVDLSRTRPIEEMQVWDGLSGARIEFQAPFSPSSTLPSSSSSWDAQFASALRPQRGSMSVMVENVNLQRAALRRIEELREEGKARVEVVEGRKVAGIEEGEGGWPVVKLEGEEARSLRARLLIGADGANSPVKAYSEIETFGWQYGRHGVVASLAVEPPPPGREGEGMSTAWQRFLPEGPVAFLPMSDTHASLVWSTTPSIASSLKSLPPRVLAPLITAAFTLPYPQLSTFLSSLPAAPPSFSAPGPPPKGVASPYSEADAAALEARLNALLLAHSRASYDPSSPPAALPPSISHVQPHSIASFPLRLSHTSSYLGLPTEEGKDRRTVLVGDAAHTVHPLAGQGLNMGLGDAEALVGLLEERAAEGGDLGAYLSLLPYPRTRYAPNHALLSACDHLHQLYSTSNPLIVSARSTGLELVNEFDSLKEFFMGRAGAANAARRKKGGAGLRGSGGGGGSWEKVADALETVGKVRSMAGMVGGMVVQQAIGRAKEVIVKGRL
ncbi:hypothetical protein JCM10213_003254 [Rhodosporidiobolus nylandii]